MRGVFSNWIGPTQKQKGTDFSKVVCDWVVVVVVVVAAVLLFLYLLVHVQLINNDCIIDIYLSLLSSSSRNKN